jgi:hypothetical protein
LRLTRGGSEAPTFFGAYGEWMMTPPPTWEHLARLGEAWEGPFIPKGITHKVASLESCRPQSGFAGRPDQTDRSKTTRS